jgi:branched-chain amino acid transport system ATP-binding protein
MTDTVVDARNVVVRFGGLVALGGVDLALGRGEAVGLIGVNGAGKTTLMNCICGLLAPRSGDIVINGTNARGLPPHEIADLGVGRTFQNPRVFRKMTLLDNMLVPALGSAEGDDALVERAEALLERMKLLALKHNYAQELSGGQQKLLELARLLMRDPDIVLLDEPFAGVHPVLCKFMIEQIGQLSREGKAILLISHDVTSIYRLSSRLVALHQGEVIATGPVEQVRNHPAVIESYLGA